MNQRGNLFAEAPEGQYKKHVCGIDEGINAAGAFVKLGSAVTAIASVVSDIPSPTLAFGIAASMYLSGAMMQALAGQSARERANQEEARRVHYETSRYVQPHPDRFTRHTARQLNPTSLSV